MSLSSGDSPATLIVPPRCKERRLAAKVRAAEKESEADQREGKAEREEAGAVHARRRTKSLAKVAASVLQERRRRACIGQTVGAQGGALFGFARKCKCSAGSATGSPAGGSSRSQVDTSVVSIASCESLQSDAHPVERHQRCSALDGPGPRKGHSGGAQKSRAGAGAGGEQRHAEKRRAGDSSGETGLVVKTLVAIRT